MVRDLLIGDFSNIKEVFKLYNRSLLFFAGKMIKDSKAAEEIVSDSFVKVWTYRHNFKTQDSIKAFLYIVTKYACRNYIKSSYSKQHFEYELTEDLISAEPDVYIKILNAELMREVYDEVAKLPEKQMKVFKLSYLDDLTTEEICERLDMSESAVFTNRSRALDTIRKSFKHKNMLFALLILDELFK